MNIEKNLFRTNQGKVRQGKATLQSITSLFCY